MQYRQVVRWVSEQPWALVPSTLAAILETVALRAAGQELTAEEIQARIGPSRADAKPESAGGVFLLPVHGVITPRASMFTEVSGGTSIPALRRAFAEAMNDEDISSIVMDFDSPGGSVAMVHEFAGEIRAARNDKRIVAQVSPIAGSAAYWLAAQADEIVAPPSASVGSIGVYAAHEDLSAKAAQDGVNIQFISAGKFKTEGNPFEPLSEKARAHIQELVDENYGRFVADVAAGRRVSEDDVITGFGEGRLVTATMGKALGMVDHLATLEQTLSAELAAGGKPALVGEKGPLEMLADQDSSPPEAPGEAAAPEGPSFVEEADAVLAAAEALLDRTHSLAEFREQDRLTAVKRERIEKLHAGFGEVLARTVKADDETVLDETHEMEFIRLSGRLKGGT